MMMSFKEFKAKNPNATMLEYFEARFPVIPSFTSGQDFFFEEVKGVTLYGPSDNNDITVQGDTGYIYNNDGWSNDWTINGSVTGTITAFDSIGTSFSAWSANAVQAWNSTSLDFNVATVDFVSWNNVDDSSLDSLLVGDIQATGDDNEFNLGWSADWLSLTGDDNQVQGGSLVNGQVAGNDNDIGLQSLEEWFGINSGDGNSLAVQNASGSNINIGNNASNTSVSVGGDTFIFDSGDSTSVRGGHGNQTIVAAGDGTSMYNGGEPGLLEQILGISDHDRFVDSGGGIDIISGFEFVELDTNGDVIILDGMPEETYLNLGGMMISASDLMPVFGTTDGNDAVLAGNGFQHTFIGAAAATPELEVLPEVYDTPVEEFLFA